MNKIRALAAFSPDALSSIAYANQEIYLGLIVAGSAGLVFFSPISLLICVLLIMVAVSYYQTIHTYPMGGGSYTVARENLGTFAGLVAAASLSIDYLLTAAVSLTAGVEAIASAFPVLWPHRTTIALLILLMITLANLRGLRETGTLMAIPVYLFLFTYLPMLAYGGIKLWLEGPSNLAIVTPPPIHPLTTFLIVHAFATGCTAMTGIEAIGNGVPYFYPPESRNAGRTLIVMAILMILLFGGSAGLIQYLGVIAGPQETVLSALARRLLGNGVAYIFIQATILLILAVAANTSFAGFPRLAAVIARDGFLPRQLTGLGDRLVFANGIVSLAFFTGALIVLFHGDSHSLIPLFAVGAFSAFTLSQAGMVMHWLRERGKWWQMKFVVNGLGALTTGITTLIVGFSKFLEGAWIVVLLIPLIIITFYKIRSHYQAVREQLSLHGLPPSLRPIPIPRIVIPISSVHRGIIDAVDLAMGMTKDITAVYVELEPGSGEHIKETWSNWFPDIPLVVLSSPYRSVIGPLLDFLDKLDLQHNDGQLAAVVLPEFVPAKWWHGLLHNQTTWLIKTALLYRRRHLGFQRVIIDIPYHLRK